MSKTIKDQLFELQDEEYRKFSSSLLPGVNNIIGVRLPALRKLAKKIAKEDWRNFITSSNNEYFEEIMLQGFVLGYVKADIEEILQHISYFIPKIDNWSICDSFCISLKFTNNNMDRVWGFIQPYIQSNQEFKIRFGIVMIIDFYINEEYIDIILKLFDNIKQTDYYVKMAVAWAVSICYIKFSDKTMEYLKNSTLDDFTYNKALQKIIESLQIDKSSKAIIKAMKRK